MPTYQYACTECGHRLEAVQSFTDAPLSQCPECAGRLRKLFNSVGIVFKGSGFYRTDSREKVGAGKPGSEAGGSSEAKPAPSNGAGSAGESTSGSSSSSGASSSTGGAAGNGASSSSSSTSAAPTAATSKA